MSGPIEGGDQVFQVGYRPLVDRGKRQPPAVAIARTMLVLAWRQRATKIVLLFCLAVLGGHGVWLVTQLLLERFGDGLTGGVPIGTLMGNTRGVLASYILWQLYATGIAVAVIAGGAVAEDRAAGAFDLYFARPLTRADYALGKLGGAAAVPIVTILLPSMLLWLVAVGIAPPAVRAGLWWPAIPTLLCAALAVALLATTIIGLSAVSRKARTVSIAYVAALALIPLITEGLASGAGYGLAGYFAPERSLRTVVQWLLEPQQGLIANGPTNHSVLGSLAGLGAWIGGGFGLFWWRLRSEVVG